MSPSATMPSTIEEVATIPLKAPSKAKVVLIAWDPDSPEHRERLYNQRVACGWKEDYVERWSVLQREGKMAIQWVVLSSEDPEKEIKLAQHVLKYPVESTPLLDSATSLGGKLRTPSTTTFIPVGHISLDSESPNPDQADPSRGLYCITTFYISRAIQGGGLGRATMDTLESEAVQEPLRAKVLSLDTLANESANRADMWKELGIGAPSLSNQDWYERRGYKVWRFVQGHIKHLAKGKVWELDAVFMKKVVA